ncbi:MAG: hypothetical protein M3Y13_09155, partial [Armatimonadota bacterium]|nr:hypothetical protein [Armatimonadota bacterium]
MNNHRKHFANSAQVAIALCALAALGGQAAQAQLATQLTSPSQLGPGTSVTPQYSFGDVNGNIGSPYSPMPPGFIGTTVTFTSQT